MTAAVAKSYEGFTAKDVVQQTIAGDGSTVVKIYYDRNSYTITYIAESNGSITGTSPQSVLYGGSTTAVTAVPAVGYHFVGVG